LQFYIYNLTKYVITIQGDRMRQYNRITNNINATEAR